MKKFCFVPCLFLITAVSAQVVVKADKDVSWKKNYRAEATKINDLVHTKLDVKFDFNHAWMYGKEWLTVKPHFYPTDSLRLDAKGMDIKEVAIVANGKKTTLQYNYDSSSLNITLNKTYKGGENYTIFIDYIANQMSIKHRAAQL